MDLIKKDGFFHKRTMSVIALLLLTGYVVMSDKVSHTWVVPAYAFLLTFLITKQLWLSIVMGVILFFVMRVAYYYHLRSMMYRYMVLPEPSLDEQIPPSDNTITTLDPIVQEVIDRYQDEKEEELDNQFHANVGTLIPKKKITNFTEAGFLGKALENGKNLVPIDLPFIENDKPVTCVTPYDDSARIHSPPDKI